MTEIARDSQSDIIYRRQRPPLFHVVVGAALMVAAAWSQWAEISAFLEHGIVPGFAAIVVASAVSAGVLGSVLYLIVLMRGLPRLTATRTELRLQLLFGTRWAEWNSLSPFESTQFDPGYGPRSKFAIANIVGPAASAKLLRKRRFIVPDSFALSLDALVADLNARRLEALGAPPHGIS